MPLGSTPTLREIMAEFNGPTGSRAYYRGGAYVPNIPANYGISTNPDALTLRQFAGAMDYTNLSASAPNVSDTVTQAGGAEITVGSSHCTISGGYGNVSYTWTKRSGNTFGLSGITTAVFTHSRYTRGTFTAVYRCTVSDGISSDYDDITVTLEVI